jgi:glycine/D-amino acid oxidase-like deaminating enzyme
LRQEKFNISELTVNDKVIVYQDVQAKQIIFCDGIQSTTNPYFSLLPFAPNKGEALIVQIPLLPRDHIYKRGMTIAPWKDDLFWVGSSYQWSFDHEQTTDAFRERTVTALNDWLKIPFTMVDHIVSIRPATLERRPFAGFHPTKKNVGILNGMGTKGCSLAPYFASQLAHAIRHQTNISPEADIKRFNNILSKHFSIGKRD